LTWRVDEPARPYGARTTAGSVLEAASSVALYSPPSTAHVVRGGGGGRGTCGSRRCRVPEAIRDRSRRHRIGRTRRDVVATALRAPAPPYGEGALGAARA